MVAESDKADADRTVGTIRLRNEELRKNYDQVILQNDHRMNVDDHVREMTEMKRLLGSVGSLLVSLVLRDLSDELSEKHAGEMQLLLRRVQVKSMAVPESSRCLPLGSGRGEEKCSIAIDEHAW